jgi:SAM-dependent methyltransferase
VLRSRPHRRLLGDGDVYLDELLGHHVDYMGGAAGAAWSLWSNVGVGRTFEDLIAEADAAPIEGWDFGWLDGRATEERPSWRYSELGAERFQRAQAVVDLQSGGGEMLSDLPHMPPLLVATEGWPPNLAVAARRLRSRAGYAVAARDDGPALPFRDGSFDLVTSRHPIVTWWGEIARVLRPGGNFLSQQVGPHSVGELTELMMGTQSARSKREPDLARQAANACGLEVVDLRRERLRTVFFDVGAVVYFLRLVVWIVPGFTVERYQGRLRVLHQLIQQDGPFVAHASRFLIEATKPA